MMNKLANDIAAAVMYKLAALAGDYEYMEKDAGSGGINHTLRKMKAKMRADLARTGTHNKPADIKEILNSPGEVGPYITFDPDVRNLKNRLDRGLRRQNEARMYEDAIVNTSGALNRIHSTSQGRRALRNSANARFNRGQNNAFSNITGNNDFIGSMNNLLEQDRNGGVTPREVADFLGIKNPEAEMLNARLINRFG